jgi:hypothetical protein
MPSYRQSTLARDSAQSNAGVQLFLYGELNEIPE